MNKQRFSIKIDIDRFNLIENTDFENGFDLADYYLSLKKNSFNGNRIENKYLLITFDTN
jgi:hypothetical protein